MAAPDRRERAPNTCSADAREQPIEQSFRFWLLIEQLLAQNIYFKRLRSRTHCKTSPF